MAKPQTKWQEVNLLKEHKEYKTMIQSQLSCFRTRDELRREKERKKARELREAKIMKGPADPGSEDEGLNALKVLPYLAWKKVLSKLAVNPEDLDNCAQTCIVFKEIVERNRETWIPPFFRVLPFVTRYLTKVDIYNCRRASKATHHWINRGLRARPFQIYFNEKIGRTYAFDITIRSTGRASCSERVKKCLKDVKRADKQGVNLFLSNALTIWFRKSYNQSDRFLTNVNELYLNSATIQKYVKHVRIVGEGFVDGQKMYDLICNIMSKIPDLRSLELDLTVPSLLFVDWDALGIFKKDASLEYRSALPTEEDLFRIDLYENPLPKLSHSRELQVKFKLGSLPPLLTDAIFKKYHLQLAGGFTINLLNLSLLDHTRKRLYCRFLNRLVIDNFGRDQFKFLENLRAPLVTELTLICGDVEDSRNVRELERNRIINLEQLGRILQSSFPILRTCTLKKFGSVLELDTCTVRFPEMRYHLSTIWKLLPASVKNLVLEEVKWKRTK